jgi:PST family polysaccharide transporter
MNETRPDPSSAGLKSKAVKGAGVNIAAQFIGTLFQTGGVVLLARLLKPSDFGMVTMVTAFSLWLMNFGVNGFTEFIIQKQDIGRKEVNSIFWMHMAVSSLLAVGFACFGFFLVDFYSEPALSAIAAVMAAGFVVQALFTTHFALLQREMQFTAIAVIDLIAVALSVVLAIGAALGGLGYWAVVTRQMAIPVVCMLAAWIACPWRPSFPRHLAPALPGLKYAAQVYSNVSLGFLTKNIDKVLLGKFHGAELLGNYDRSFHLFSMPANQILTPLHNVALATLSRLKHDQEKFTAYYAKAVAVLAFPSALLALVLTLCAQDLVLLLLGPNWADAGPVVMAFGPGIASTIIYGTHSWLHLSLGTPNRWFKWNLCATALTVAAFVAAAPFGAVAMAAAYSARAYLLTVPALWYAGRPIHFSLGAVMQSVWAYFVAAAFVGVFWLYLAGSWAPFHQLLAGLNPLVRIIASSSAASALYICLVVVLQRDLRSIRETLALILLAVSKKKAPTT